MDWHQKGFSKMRVPDFDKIRVILSQDTNDDYMSMSNEDLLYEYVKIHGNTVPTKEKEWIQVT